RQDDGVGLKSRLQRGGDDRRSNRTSLRRQRLRRPATRDCHVDVFTGERVGERLAYLAESDNCISHTISPFRIDTSSPALNAACDDLHLPYQTWAMPPST